MRLYRWSTLRYYTHGHDDSSPWGSWTQLSSTANPINRIQLQAGARVEVIHNASVMGAVASCGLQLYQFGQTVSIPFFEGTWRPDSFYDKIAYNKVSIYELIKLIIIIIALK